MKEIKISFIGDIMCEKPFLKAAKHIDGTYHFEGAFSGLKSLFAGSDLVVGNLETVFGGCEAGYSNELYSFNTPDSFVDELRNAGIYLVSTANNHCLDRGIPAIVRTLDVLDAAGIQHVGTYRTKEEADRDFILEIEGIRFGFISYTYGTNSNINHVILDDEELFMVDLLQPQKKSQCDTSLMGKLKSCFSVEIKTKIKKLLGKEYKNITTDTMGEDFNHAWLSRIDERIERLKPKVDHVICLLHCGGQFNREPGEYAEFFMNYFAEKGIKLIIGNHPHLVQKMIARPDGISTYCLGNVSISPSSIYVPSEVLPEYSIALNLFFDRETKNFVRATANVLKIIEDSRHFIKTVDVCNLYNDADTEEKKRLREDTGKVLKAFMNKEFDNFEMSGEWEIELQQ